MSKLAADLVALFLLMNSSQPLKSRASSAYNAENCLDNLYTIFEKFDMDEKMLPKKKAEKISS